MFHTTNMKPLNISPITILSLSGTSRDFSMLVKKYTSVLILNQTLMVTLSQRTSGIVALILHHPLDYLAQE